MQTEEVIQNILNDATPVRVLTRPTTQMLLWALGVLLYNVLLGMHIGLREDLGIKLMEPAFWLELILSFVTIITASLAACFLALPDAWQKSWIRPIPVVSFSILTVLLFCEWINPGIQGDAWIGITDSWYQCAGMVLLLAALPLLVLLLFAGQGVSIQPSWTAAMIGLSSANVAYVMLRLTEPNDVGAHLMLWHFLPVVLVVLGCVVLGRRFLQW